MLVLCKSSESRLDSRLGCTDDAAIVVSHLLEADFLARYCFLLKHSDLLAKIAELLEMEVMRKPLLKCTITGGTFSQCLLRVGSTAVSALPTAPAPRPNSYRAFTSSGGDYFKTSYEELVMEYYPTFLLVERSCGGLEAGIKSGFEIHEILFLLVEPGLDFLRWIGLSQIMPAT